MLVELHPVKCPLFSLFAQIQTVALSCGVNVPYSQAVVKSMTVMHVTK